MFLKNSFILIILIISSCQPVELIRPIEIDNSRFQNVSISAKELILNVKYNPIFSDNNIEDQINNPPVDLITTWINDNVKIFGNQNKLVINILDASIVKKEIDNLDAKKYEEKTIFLYEIFFLVEYEIYDDNNYLLANTTVESSRSTTSKKYISLNETEVIVNDLLNNVLIDFTNETKKMMQLYMGEFML